MAAKSRRKAREGALRTLYEMEVGGSALATALKDTQDTLQLPEPLANYMEQLVRGVWREQENLDGRLAPLIRDYDFDRLAAVDRTILRVCAFELLYEPSIPPAVTIDEAVEIAKKFSTAESGRFVNGVLGKLLQNSPKANWSPETAPPEQMEEPEKELEQEPVTEIVESDSPEAIAGRKFGAWTIREANPPPGE